MARTILNKAESASPFHRTQHQSTLNLPVPLIWSAVSVESDSGPLGWFGFEHLPKRIEYRLELAVVATLERIDSMSQFRVARDGMPKPYERSDDSNADGHRLWAAQDGRKHGDTMFGEREGPESKISPAGGCGRKLRPHGVYLFGRELKEEIVGESSEIATHLLVQPSGGHAVEPGKIDVEHDAAAAYGVDEAFDFSIQLAHI